MMFFQEWNVLLVDDEPDVLSITKLALHDVRVYGLPIKIFTAQSKAQAIDLLHTDLAVQGVPEGSLAVAFIDVVMESQHAGLELRDYIRHDLGNSSAQLYIRTGQPGVMPEREVVEHYDISGYFTKVEATEQKLFTFVKAGIRQWYTIYYARLISEFTNAIIANSATKQQLSDLIGPTNSFDDFGLVSGLVFERDTLFSDFTAEEVYALHDELDPLPPAIQLADGHKLVVDGTRLMVKIAPTPNTAEFFYVADSPMVMPPFLLNITFNNGLVLATMWKRAQ
jgi:CheY-like chemotaxis protein